MDDDTRLENDDDSYSVKLFKELSRLDRDDWLRSFEPDWNAPPQELEWRGPSRREATRSPLRHA